MLQDYSNKTVLVYDNGLFVEMAIKLSKYFGKVYYHTPWESSYPKSNELLIGYGIEGIERVDSIWPYINEVDLWVFPDVYSGPLQEYLEGIGKRVWGSRCGEEMELDRSAAKEVQEELGIRTGPYECVIGLEALREYLMDHEDVYVKISKTRGDMETFHAINYEAVEPRLDELEHHLGAKKHIIEFIVEDAINDAVEIGYDGFSVDGKFPTSGIVGIEVKDQCYIGQAGAYDLLPKQILDVNKKISETFKTIHYRNFMAFELRVTKDGKYYSIDPCMRQGSPPSEVLLEMYANLPDILWFGGEGVCVDPVFTGKWGAMMMIKSDWARNNWQPLDFPESIRDSIKLRYAAKIEGKYYVVPQGTDCLEVGAVVGVANTVDAAIAACKKAAEKVSGYYVNTYPETFDDALKGLASLKRSGFWLGKN